MEKTQPLRERVLSLQNLRDESLGKLNAKKAELDELLGVVRKLEMKLA